MPRVFSQPMKLHCGSLAAQELAPRLDLEIEKMCKTRSILEPLMRGQESLLLRALVSPKESKCVL